MYTLDGEGYYRTVLEKVTLVTEIRHSYRNVMMKEKGEMSGPLIVLESSEREHGIQQIQILGHTLY